MKDDDAEVKKTEEPTVEAAKVEKSDKPEKKPEPTKGGRGVGLHHR